MFEQTIRNFKINFIRHDGRNSFSSGDQIIGHISFDLTKETKITSITTRLKGNVNVHWTAGGGGGKQETLLCKAGLLRLKRSYFARRQGYAVTGAVWTQWYMANKQSLSLSFSYSYSWDKTSTRDACVSVHMSAPTRVCMTI